VIAMHAYKQKIRSHPVMQMMAGRLSDEEIAALAAYFSDLE
jgi:cytochrome c